MDGEAIAAPATVRDGTDSSAEEGPGGDCSVGSDAHGEVPATVLVGGVAAGAARQRPVELLGASRGGGWEAFGRSFGAGTSVPAELALETEQRSRLLERTGASRARLRDRSIEPGARTGRAHPECACLVCGNARRARAVVTRYGCRRGDFFEGSNSHRGEAERGAGRSLSGSRRSGNAVNPRLAAGCNKPAKVVRSKPSKWCETTGAERDRPAWQPGADGREPWSGRTIGCRRGGEETPGEAGSAGMRARDASCRSEGEAKAQEVGDRHRQVPVGIGPTEDREAPPGDG